MTNKKSKSNRPKVLFDNGNGNHEGITLQVDKLPKQTKEHYLNMSEEEYLALKGKEKSRAAIIRNRHKRPKTTNPKGRNQYTEALLVKNLIKSNREKTLAKLDELNKDMIDHLSYLMFHGKLELTQLRAIELALAYSIGKPNTREAPKEENGEKAPMIVMPAQEINKHNEIIEKAKIIKKDK